MLKGQTFKTFQTHINHEEPFKANGTASAGGKVFIGLKKFFVNGYFPSTFIFFHSPLYLFLVFFFRPPMVIPPYSPIFLTSMVIGNLGSDSKDGTSKTHPFDSLKIPPQEPLFWISTTMASMSFFRYINLNMTI